MVVPFEIHMLDYTWSSRTANGATYFEVRRQREHVPDGWRRVED